MDHVAALERVVGLRQLEPARAQRRGTRVPLGEPFGVHRATEQRAWAAVVNDDRVVLDEDGVERAADERDDLDAIRELAKHSNKRLMLLECASGLNSAGTHMRIDRPMDLIGTRHGRVVDFCRAANTAQKQGPRRDRFHSTNAQHGAGHAEPTVMSLSMIPTAPRVSRVPDPARLHRALSAFNERRLNPALPDDPATPLDEEIAMRTRELAFVEQERLAVADAAREAPTTAKEFVAWFEALKGSGPGENDSLFPWLAERASLAELTWFLEQEVAGEAGFDDLVALTQVKFGGRAKIEMGNNYWDELGRGNLAGMHGPLLGRLAQTLSLNPHRERVVWEALAVGNLLVAVATNRRYAYHSVGALGAVELTAPWRAAHVNRALKRVGIAGEDRRYYALHATLDVKHSEQWDRDVLSPLVEENPRVATAIAEGALMRLSAGARSFRRYRAQFGL